MVDSNQIRDKTCLVTVGTTNFDPLIYRVNESDCSEILQRFGLSLLCQIGNGKFEPPCKFFRYKPDIQEDIRQSDIIIGHAGAGTIIEVLRERKKLLVVINSDLMNNHQIEIAEELDRSGYLTMCENLEYLPEKIIEC